jgi:hypothetical protein
VKGAVAVSFGGDTSWNQKSADAEYKSVRR